MHRDHYMQWLKDVLTRHHINHDVEEVWDDQEGPAQRLTYGQYESILWWIREVFHDRCFMLDSEHIFNINLVMKAFHNVITTGVSVVWPSVDQNIFGGYLPEEVAVEILTIFAAMEREVISDGSSHWQQYLQAKDDKIL